MKWDLAIFDLDGTLLDTVEDLGCAVNDALEKRGFPTHSPGEYRKMIGHGGRHLVKSALPEAYRDDDELISQYIHDYWEYYMNHIDIHTIPFPGIPELLHDLAGKGTILAIASNKFQEGTEKLIHLYFPDIHFAAVLGNRPGYPLKPDALVIKNILQATGAKKDRTIFIGDAGSDIETALNANVASVGVLWGYRPEEDLKPADYLAESVTELRNILL